MQHQPKQPSSTAIKPSWVRGNSSAFPTPHFSPLHILISHLRVNAFSVSDTVTPWVALLHACRVHSPSGRCTPVTNHLFVNYHCLSLHSRLPGDPAGVTNAREPVPRTAPACDTCNMCNMLPAVHARVSPHLAILCGHRHAQPHGLARAHSAVVPAFGEGHKAELQPSNAVGDGRVHSQRGRRIQFGCIGGPRLQREGSRPLRSEADLPTPDRSLFHFFEPWHKSIRSSQPAGLCGSTDCWQRKGRCQPTNLGAADLRFLFCRALTFSVPIDMCLN